MERDEEKDSFEVSMRGFGRTDIPACPSDIRTASGDFDFAHPTGR